MTVPLNVSSLVNLWAISFNNADMFSPIKHLHIFISYYKIQVPYSEKIYIKLERKNSWIYSYPVM